MVFDNVQDLLDFLNFLNKKYFNIKFTIEKQVNNSIAFLGIFISSINNKHLTLRTYYKLTYNEFLLTL